MPVHLVAHAVVQDALLALRDRTTTTCHFRRLARRVSQIIAVEGTRELRTTRHTVETPLERTEGQQLTADVVVVPVLRAGLGMVEAVLDLLPHARVGHVGLQRDERTAEASRYYAKLPADLSKTTVLIVDPMLATGGSAVAVLDLVAAAGAKDVRLLCVVAAPEGLAAVATAHPQVEVFTAAVDRTLDARKFILPGLGDFGDRLYGTD